MAMTPEYISTHYGENYEEQMYGISTPIYQTSSFLEEGSAYKYSRSSNPNFVIVEKKIAALNNAKWAIFTSCGISAVHACLAATLKAGDHMVVVRTIYPTARKLVEEMERYNITHTYVKSDTVEDIEAAIRPNTKLIYLESPSSIVLEVQDLARVAAIAGSKGIITMTDNTCATPLFQKPVDMGIDLVIYSATKYFSGHSDTVAGFVCGNDEALREKIYTNRYIYGYNNAPFSAWLIERGLRTFKMRVEQSQKSAGVITEYLDSHPAIERVFYPALKSSPYYESFKKQMTGAGGLFSIKTRGTYEQNKRFMKELKLFTYASSWGGHESLVYPLGATEPLATAFGNEIYYGGVIRMYAGIENTEELLADVKNAMKVFE